MLGAGLEVLSPRCEEEGSSQTTAPDIAMYFSVPGAADIAISHQEWREAYHIHQSQGSIATPTCGKTELGDMGCCAVSDPSADRGRVPVAWGSSSLTELGGATDLGEATELVKGEEQLVREQQEVSAEGAELQEEIIKNEW